MKAALKRVIRSPKVAWLVVISMTVLSAGALLYCIEHLRHRSGPVETALARLMALDPHERRKICAHRGNDAVKYRAAALLFYCVEIDVVVNPPTGGPIAVYHPPAENDRGLTLTDLVNAEGLPRGNLWLDVKDLSSSNWLYLLDELDALIPVARRQDLIIETGWSEPSVQYAAARFRDAGYWFSYYLPTEDAIRCGDRSDAFCETFRRRVLDTLGTGFSHLSFDFRGYSFVQSIRDRLPPNIRLLTWHIRRPWPQMDLLKDVDIYIVTMPGRYAM